MKWENSSVENLKIGTNGEPKISTIALFSKGLLIKLFDEFIDFKDQFTIRKLDQMEVLGRRIANYNRMMDELNKSLDKGEKRRSYLNENRVKMILKLMQSNSVDELVKEGVISKRSKYNYLRTIKRLGLNKNFIGDQGIDFLICDDFIEYYSFIENIIPNLQSSMK